MAIVNKNPEYFLTIAKEGNISKAADILYVSQSYLSQYISKLESSFDVKLFDRSKTPIELTEAGKIYFNYLQANNQLYSKLTSDFDALNQERANTLNLGIAPWRGSTMLPDILPLFIEKNKNVQIYLHEHPARQLFDLIEKNIVDFAVMNVSLDEHSAVNIEFIKYEKIMLVGNKNNPLTKKLTEIEARKETIDIRLLEDECFILMKEGMSCEEWIYNYLDNIHFSPAKRIVTSSKATACNLVAQNMGFSFIPDGGIRWSAGTKELKFFDLQSNDLIAPLAAVYKKNTYLSNVARKFIDIMKEYYLKDFKS
ncbi:MAG: LysR family transcriptional regulator [Cloacibacillus porcorum]|uniref:LysR family transcriptional regulator n=1 Tax=Cloacibacillus porcorum TaxID=1197717 RepID=UPI0023F1E562|nr:LysR family transcriptional regulator [Cloacibacillus porcorum]MCD7876433.1 LysR family transcriptional regulator [Cloacibacillus porcorum]